MSICYMIYMLYDKNSFLYVILRIIQRFSIRQNVSGKYWYKLKLCDCLFDRKSTYL